MHVLNSSDVWMSVTVNTSSLDVVIKDLKKFSTYEVTVAGFNRIGQGPASHVHITTDEDGKNIEIISNTRAGIEGKIWERSYWGANQL